MGKDKIETVTAEWKWWLLAAIIGIFPHLPYLNAYFFMDDFWHLAGLQSGNYIWSTWEAGRENIDRLWYMTRDVFPQMAWVNRIQFYFRPLYVASIALDYKIAGFYALPYHLHNLLWHALAVILVYVLSRRFGIDRRIAFIGSAIFGLHPLVAEPVGWISARCDLQATVMMLAASLSYLSWRQTSNLSKALATLLFFLLALLAKEHAAVFAFIICGYELSSLKSSEKRKLLFPIILLGISLCFLAWRLSQSGEPGTWSMAQANKESFLLFGPVSVIGYNTIAYLKLMILGFPPVPFSSANPPLGSGYFVVGIVTIGLSGIALWIWRHRQTRFLLWWLVILTFAIIWIPASGRYFYAVMPSVGVLFCLTLEKFKAGKLFKPIVLLLFTYGLYAVILSFAYSYTAASSQRYLRQSLETICNEVNKNKEITKIYLLHLPPSFVHMDTIIPAMCDRKKLDVRPLTFVPSLYLPSTSEVLKSISQIVYPIKGSWLQQVNTETTALSSNTLLLTSKPLGFFSGPARFGWNSQSLPAPPEGAIRLDGKTVRFGNRLPDGGIGRLLFEFDNPLDDPSILWMEWHDGNIRQWQPDF